MALYTPPAAFHFRAEFDLGATTAADMEFSDVSGLNVEVTEEEVREGGENRYVHKLPGRAKYTNVVLKRGLLVDTGLRDWILDTVQTLTVVPVTVWIKLLDAEHAPLRTWTLIGCWPVKWTVGDFSAQQSALAVESLELAYTRFKVD